MESIIFSNRKSGAKLLALALAFSLCLFAFPTEIVRADDSVAKLVGETITDVGAGASGVEMVVSITDCPPFWGMGLEIRYDNSNLALTAIQPDPGIPANATFLGNFEGGVVTIDGPANANLEVADGPLFTLVFDVAESALTDRYNVVIKILDDDDDNFINISGTQLDMTFGEAGDGIVGQIEVTGLKAAKVGATEYETLSGALTAALTESSATITMLSSVTVSQVSDRIVIPDGKEITLDMNGKTIISGLPGNPVDGSNKPLNDSVESGLIEVQAGGKLNVVDNSVGKGGGFTHAAGDRYTRCLINSGTLNMSDVSITNFYDGVRDGSLFTGKGSGTYGTISNCEFTATAMGGISNFQKVALNFNAGTADTVENCTINYSDDTKNSRSVVVGTSNNGGSLNLLKDCTLNGLVSVSKNGTVSTIQDNTIINTVDDFARGLEINGHVGTIDGGYTQGVYDALYIGSSGTVDLILDGEFEAWDQAVFNYGTVDEVRGGNFHTGYYSAYYNVGTTNLISGGVFQSDDYQCVNNEGYIGEISGGEFYAGSKYYGVENSNTIDIISGGYFYSDTYSPLLNGPDYASHRSVINEISGGTFISNGNSSTLTCRDGYNKYGPSYEGSTIKSISGGTFISKNQSAINIYGTDSIVQSITGGTFIGKVAALKVKENDIDSISGGVFYGEGVAVYLDGATGEHETHITDLSGGYFKTLGEYGPIVALGDSSWASVSGYNLATVPLRVADLPTDFPDTDIIEDPTGFYHFGETAEVTWKVDEELAAEDLFVMDDPVYYTHTTPLKGGFKFKGWQLGDYLYRPQDDMPVASGPVTYQAAFLAQGDPEDYEVALGLPVIQSVNVNAGEVFEIDVFVTSLTNEAFFGATVPIEFEHAKVDYVGFAEYLPGLDIGPISEGSFEIVGAAAGDDGWAITGGSAKLGTLKFKAKSGVTSSTTEIAIGEDPIVDQYDAVGNQVVDGGGHVEIKLWNLQVTFKAGDNVTMVPAEAVAYVKYNQAGLWANADYSEAFTEPGLEPGTHYTLDEPVWSPAAGDNVSFGAIELASFTANAVYTATAHAKSYTFRDLQEALVEVDGLVGDSATYLTPVTFKVKVKEGYGLDKVSYRVDDGDWDVLLDDAGVYTIAGNLITGAIEVQVDYRVSGGITFISNDDYRALPTGYKILVLTVGEKLSDQAYTYDGALMFYSSLYSKVDENKYVYLYVVANGVEVADARQLIQIADGACTVLAYDGDVNCDTRFNSTDAVLTYGLYKGVHEQDTSFTRVKMKMLLEADVNGDGVVDVLDAQTVLSILWKKP